MRSFGLAQNNWKNIMTDFIRVLGTTCFSHYLKQLEREMERDVFSLTLSRKFIKYAKTKGLT